MNSHEACKKIKRLYEAAEAISTEFRKSPPDFNISEIVTRVRAMEDILAEARPALDVLSRRFP